MPVMKSNSVKMIWPLITISMIYFSLCIGYFFSYTIANFPDGISHMGYVYDVFLHNYPNYSNGTNFIGEKFNHLNHPPLYYLLAGGVAKIDYFGHHIVTIVQMVNVAISFFILFIVWKILRELNFSQVGVFCGLLMIMLTPMFLELSVAVNNDPLSILGCAIAFYGIVCCHYDDRKFNHSILFIVVGSGIASLTKGTGALTIVCMVVTYFIFNFKLWWGLSKKITSFQWGVITIFTLAVLIYYLVTYTTYHSLFPAPQGNPADWFAVTHPDASRWNILEHIHYFLLSNYHTYITPYGHGDFVDSENRVLLIDVFLIVFFILLFTVGFIIRRDKFLLIGFISFVLFMVLYFYTIRQMHLRTGYPGAMQARYFYGFLPVFSIGVASIYDDLRFKWLRMPFFLFLLLNISLAFIPAWSKASSILQKNTMIEQVNSNVVFGELVKGRVFSQSFKATKHNLDSISLKLATFARNNMDTVKVEVCSTAGQCLFSKEINTLHLVDNGWLQLPVKITNLKVGDEYMIKLTSLTGKIDNAITWWALQQPSEDPHFAHTHFGPTILPVKFYDGGEAIVDGHPVPNVDFAFRLIFK
jgi:hypothetical protein